ncbi:MAG: DUF6338 family protein [Actinomycetota bacterium]|nr:DUF6338 family protein [Actinomycetota bacterium]
MLSTIAGIVAAVALLLPGFTVAELAKSGRARARESDLEMALRALFYALAIHLAFAWWTRLLVLRIHSVDDWPSHLNALLLYGAVVLGLVPVTVGLLLNRYLRRAEAGQRPVGTLQRVLGGRDAGDAWDAVFPQLVHGSWLVVELRSDDPSRPAFTGGKFGKLSAAGQSPAEHNLYLEEMWTVSTTFPRDLVEGIEPPRGIWLPAGDIRGIQILSPPGADLD